MLKGDKENGYFQIQFLFKISRFDINSVWLSFDEFLLHVCFIHTSLLIRKIQNQVFFLLIQFLFSTIETLTCEFTIQNK